MAPPKRPWFRLYVEVIWDRKLRRLSPEHRWLWVTVLACARSSAIPGWLLLHENEGAMTEEDIADAAALKVAQVRSGLEKMVRLGMIEWDNNLDAWHVTNWKERQFESDETTKRTAKHRTKERSNNAEVTPPETETDNRDRYTPRPPASGGAAKNPRANGTNPRAVAEREKQQEAQARQDRIDACPSCDENGLLWNEESNKALRCPHVGVPA